MTAVLVTVSVSYPLQFIHEMNLYFVLILNFGIDIQISIYCKPTDLNLRKKGNQKSTQEPQPGEENNFDL